MTRLLLITYHGTVVQAADDGQVIHCDSELSTANILFNTDGQLCSIPDNMAGNHFQGGTLDNITKTVSFRDKGEFVSALPGGSFARRSTCQAWEKFKLVPENVLTRIQGTVLPALLPKGRSGSIPKIIHQTFAAERIPGEFSENAASLVAANPGWEYRYYSDKGIHDFIYDCYGWDVLELYLRINPRYGAAKADFFRYLCIYQFGGVYLDIKSSSQVALDNVLLTSDQFLLCQWDQRTSGHFSGWGLQPELSHIPGGEYQNWHIVSISGHPFLAAVIERVMRNIKTYDENIHGTGKQATLRTTGPIAYTKAIHPIREFHNHRLLEPERSPFTYRNVQGHEQKLGSHYGLEHTPLIL